IRKFYDEVLRLRLKLDSANDKEKKFAEILPYLRMLIPKVIYSKSRNNVDESFESFIKMNIENITKVKEFEVFCDLFEAVIAYTKKYPNLKK
ncbi:MAG: type III-A CRISPR-associated protein Csm2, partial [Desulfurella sp.]|uniref:type III-A CRISPR-associated protein Csm2 n=1 Tax=Desulfurella sp. TaxID=1962857 RepID=UPI003C737FA2